MLLALLLLAAGAALLVAGAEAFAENAAAAARRLGTSALAVGLLVAGAEPEELVTAVVASAGGRPDLAAGDALGANATLLTLALGAAALLRPVPVGPRVRRYALLAATAGLAAVAALADGVVGRVEGALLLTAYAAAVALVVCLEGRAPAFGELAELEQEEDRAGGRGGRAAPLLVLGGVALMALGGAGAVAGASRAADALGVADGPVGLTLLALATSVELVALLAAARRHGVEEVAVAGVVGAVVCNATVTLGAAALVAPLATTGMLRPALAAALLPLVLVAVPRRLPRAAGAALVAAYALWVALVLA
ncbi:sodium:calcium antiporter [Vallicoccus soli]|uniref:sodium:calcium antiporter n=1 Tax=Vallicoccus soli TaxID=2339232 RepID=UPI001402BEF1|nr:sodium:calcium antiporter [Vallicoccus soli]